MSTCSNTLRQIRQGRRDGSAPVDSRHAVGLPASGSAPETHAALICAGCSANSCS